MLSAVADQDIVSVRHWLVLCSMSGYAGFLKLFYATAFKSLYANRQAVRHSGWLRACLSPVSVGISHAFRLYFETSLYFLC